MQNNRIRNLDLPLPNFNVTMQGRGGAYVRDLAALYNNCDVTPHLAVIDIGTNDLSMVHSVQQATNVAKSVFDFASSLVARGVKQVVILEVLPRTRYGRHGAPRSFNSLVQAYNSQIRALVCQNNVPISYWFHAELSSQTESFIMDGVHLTNAGISRYLRSLKRAILRYGASLDHSRGQHKDTRDVRLQKTRTDHEVHHDEKNTGQEKSLSTHPALARGECRDKSSSKVQLSAFPNALPTSARTHATRGRKRKRSDLESDEDELWAVESWSKHVDRSKNDKRSKKTQASSHNSNVRMNNTSADRYNVSPTRSSRHIPTPDYFT